MDFNKCTHKWVFHIDVDKCGGYAAGNTIFRCENCNHYITLTEKCALDQVRTQEESLKIQEKYTKTGMVANIIAAATLIIAFLVLLFGDKIININN
jgi:hypothetical protein